jgi:hypothetical protein
MPAQLVDEGTVVGRQDELGVLQHAHAEAAAGESRLAFLADADPTVSRSEQ